MFQFAPPVVGGKAGPEIVCLLEFSRATAVGEDEPTTDFRTLLTSLEMFPHSCSLSCQPGEAVPTGPSHFHSPFPCGHLPIRNETEEYFAGGPHLF